MAQGVPLAVALIAIPALLRSIGVERFGVLALVWALIGYTGLFDLGLGRAMTKLIADRLGHGEAASIAPLFWTGLLLMTAVGVAGTGALLLTAPWLVTEALRISPAVTEETLAAFRVVAIGIPVVTLDSRPLLQSMHFSAPSHFSDRFWQSGMPIISQSWRVLSLLRGPLWPSRIFCFACAASGFWPSRNSPAPQ
jgi:hypothetical protein